EDDPWLPQHLVWPLLQVIDASLGEPWCTDLTRHLGADGEPDAELAQVRAGRRYSVALRLAGLFHRYATSRPRVLRDWREGRDTDGLDATPLDADLTWQPELWRRLVAAVDAPPPGVRRERAVAPLRAGGGGDLPLPARLARFGHTRLRVTEVAVREAPATTRGVTRRLPRPWGALWQEPQATLATEVVPRDRDESGAVVRHPLLASLGRD